MTKRSYFVIAGLILMALVALLIYSLDRTSWLLAQYELAQPDTLAAWLGLAPLTLGVAAALVIEIGAVALVAGDVLASDHPHLKRYAVAGLAVVLAVQALANLLAGFIRGYQAVLTTLTAHDTSAALAWWVAGFAWALSSVAVPSLIFILSRLAALTLRLAIRAPVSAVLETAQSSLEALPERSIAAEGAQVPDSVPTFRPLEEEALLETLIVLDQSTARNGNGHLSEPLGIVEIARYECPHCQAPLATKQARGAAVKNGYCLSCKSVRKVA